MHYDWVTKISCASDFAQCWCDTDFCGILVFHIIYTFWFGQFGGLFFNCLVFKTVLQKGSSVYMYISSLSALQTFANFVDPDETTSYDELSSGSTLFAILFCQIGSKTDLSKC